VDDGPIPSGRARPVAGRRGGWVVWDGGDQAGVGKPVIAAVDGLAAGAGVSMAHAGDPLLASDTARFSPAARRLYQPRLVDGLGRWPRDRGSITKENLVEIGVDSKD